MSLLVKRRVAYLLTASCHLRAQPGVWDGLSSEEAKEAYPDEWERFLKDPYAHRAPRAESYHDLSGASPVCRLRRLACAELTGFGCIICSPARERHL